MPDARPYIEDIHLTAPDREIRTPRLRLVPWTLELIDAFIANDQAAAEQALDVRFPEPFGPPPETGDVLQFFHDSIAYDASNGAFVVRMMVRTEDRMAVGNIGLVAPDEAGRAMYGYSVYPEFEGNGYASEAAKAMVEFGLALDSVQTVYATIPVGHTASEIVSSRAGLTLTPHQIEDEGMILNIWEKSRS
ncbi:MAG TPA: GNAT family N-acetyltransferase [Thermomicrobiales bacterium]|nr:GNAT family N-acetyltransferase [Thermomicrobiales bacterium]